MDEPNTASVTTQESATAAPNAEAASPVTPPSDGQAAQAAAVEAPAVEEAKPVDYRALYEKDPGLKAFVEGRAGDIAKRQTQKLQRDLEKQRLSRAAEDPVEAITFAQERRATLEAEDAAEAGSAQKWAAVTSAIRETAKADPDWGKEYQEVVAANHAEADRLFAEDPDRFHTWVDNKILDLRVDRKVDRILKERLPVLVEARATDQVNKALQGVPVLPTGTGGDAGLPSLKDIDDMTPEEYERHRDRVLANLDRYRR